MFKKAHELSVLCNCEVALIILSNQSRLYQYVSNSPLSALYERINEISPEESYNSATMNEYINRRLKKVNEDSTTLSRPLLPQDIRASSQLFRSPPLINKIMHQGATLRQLDKSNEAYLGGMQGMIPVDYQGRLGNTVDVGSLGNFPYSPWNSSTNTLQQVPELANYHLSNGNFNLINGSINGNHLINFDGWKNDMVANAQSSAFHVWFLLTQENHAWSIPVPESPALNFMNLPNEKDDRQYGTVYPDPQSIYQSPLGSYVKLNNQSLHPRDQNPLRISGNDKEFDVSKL